MIERAVLEDFWGKEKELDRWMYEWMYEWSMPFWAWPTDLNRRLSCNAKRGCCMDKTFVQDRVGMEWYWDTKQPIPGTTVLFFHTDIHSLTIGLGLARVTCLHPLRSTQSYQQTACMYTLIRHTN